jgi:hypothetical protein
MSKVGCRPYERGFGGSAPLFHVDGTTVIGTGTDYTDPQALNSRLGSALQILSDLGLATYEEEGGYRRTRESSFFQLGLVAYGRRKAGVGAVRLRVQSGGLLNGGRSVEKPVDRQRADKLSTVGSVAPADAGAEAQAPAPRVRVLRR